MTRTGGYDQAVQDADVQDALGVHGTAVLLLVICFTCCGAVWCRYLLSLPFPGR